MRRSANEGTPMITERPDQRMPESPRRSPMRITLLAILALALIAASAIFIPKVVGARSSKKPAPNLTTPPTKPVATSPTTPRTSGTPVAVTSAWPARVSVMDGFWLRVPPDWKGGWFEGTWDFEPKTLPSPAEDGNTFTVTLSVVSGEFDSIAPRGAKKIMLDAAPEVRVWLPGPRRETYSIPWD